jgi:hypothetical protein
MKSMAHKPFPQRTSAKATHWPRRQADLPGAAGRATMRTPAWRKEVTVIRSMGENTDRRDCRAMPFANNQIAAG